MDWFLYDNGLRHERIKKNLANDYINPIIFRPNTEAYLESIGTSTMGLFVKTSSG